MDDKTKRRIYLFYFAGVVNLLVGGYVLLFGRGFLPEDKIIMLVLFFVGFAAVDFYMPIAIKKKWEAEVAKLEEQRRNQSGKTLLK